MKVWVHCLDVNEAYRRTRRERTASLPRYDWYIVQKALRIDGTVSFPFEATRRYDRNTWIGFC
jgi:hypothetical protein